VTPFRGCALRSDAAGPESIPVAFRNRKMDFGLRRNDDE
jgi:hypothetical protein